MTCHDAGGTIPLSIALALLMARGVNCLVLDEPTAGLDPKQIDEVQRQKPRSRMERGR